MNASEGERFDVIVVGAGNAGLIAAIAAREEGARVLMLEASPKEERGGNSRFASGMFRIAHSGASDIQALVDDTGGIPWAQIEIEPYSEEQYFDDLLRLSSGEADPTLLRLVIEHSGETVRWMREHGVPWSLSHSKFMSTDGLAEDEILRLPAGGELIVNGNGIALVESLFRAAEKAGVAIWYEAFGRDLVMDGLRVTGVDIVMPASEQIVSADTVILASGSIEASREARLRYLGPGWDLVRVRGTRYNTGRMLDAAIDAGALSAGHWSGVHSVAVDADITPAFGDLSIGDTNARYSYPYGAMVNLNGERFLDEGRDEMHFTYAEVGRQLLDQPKVTAFQIFDDKTVHLLEPRYATASPAIADSLEELADVTGIDSESFVATISEFNASCSDGRFDPYSKDGLSSRPHGQPPKSNWALPLDTPPYRAYRVTCGVTFAFAGVGIDSSTRVLAVSGRPMEGLYACGEIAGGIIAHNVPSGGGLIKGGVLALIAGREAGSRTQKS